MKNSTFTTAIMLNKEINELGRYIRELEKTGPRIYKLCIVDTESSVIKTMPELSVTKHLDSMREILKHLELQFENL